VWFEGFDRFLWFGFFARPCFSPLTTSFEGSISRVLGLYLVQIMKFAYAILFSAGLIAFSRDASGQNFINLNFEQAKIVLDTSSEYYPYAAYTSDALPGWTIGNNFMGPNEIFYNDLSLGAPSVALFGTNSEYSPPPLDGKFSIGLYGGVNGPYPPVPGVYISQTALVPTNAESILFKAQGYFSNGPLLLSLGGQNISFAAISTTPDYTLYGGDISAFAGQIETLTFDAPSGVNNYWELDDIQFSPSPVPEPDVLGIYGIGGLLFYCLRNLHRRRWSH
jgi:hypothetical protein